MCTRTSLMPWRPPARRKLIASPVERAQMYTLFDHPEEATEDGALMECHEEGPPRRRHSPVTNPIGKEARGEVCRTRLGVSDGAVVRTRSRRRDRRRGPDRC